MLIDAHWSFWTNVKPTYCISPAQLILWEASNRLLYFQGFLSPWCTALTEDFSIQNLKSARTFSQSNCFVTCLVMLIWKFVNILWATRPPSKYISHPAQATISIGTSQLIRYCCCNSVRAVFSATFLRQCLKLPQTRSTVNTTTAHLDATWCWTQFFIRDTCEWFVLAPASQVCALLTSCNGHSRISTWSYMRRTMVLGESGWKIVTQGTSLLWAVNGWIWLRSFV